MAHTDADEVAPRLYVGSKPPPIPYGQYDTIVLAAIEYQPPASWFEGTEVIHAPFDDAPTRRMYSNEIVTATNAAQLVARRLREGRRVLVTCAMGINRSALIAALAMHEVWGMSAEEILARIRRARSPWALSNGNFVQLLRAVIDAKRSRDQASL